MKTRKTTLKRKMSYGTYLTPTNVRWVDRFAKKENVTKSEAINRLLDATRKRTNARSQKQVQRDV